MADLAGASPASEPPYRSLPPRLAAYSPSHRSIPNIVHQFPDLVKKPSFSTNQVIISTQEEEAISTLSDLPAQNSVFQLKMDTAKDDYFTFSKFVSLLLLNASVIVFSEFFADLVLLDKGLRN
ncbi:hypothetical protein Bca101_019316 [Brassica carinata]